MSNRLNAAKFVKQATRKMRCIKQTDLLTWFSTHFMKMDVCNPFHHSDRIKSPKKTSFYHLVKRKKPKQKRTKAREEIVEGVVPRNDVVVAEGVAPRVGDELSTPSRRLRSMATGFSQDAASTSVTTRSEQ